MSRRNSVNTRELINAMHAQTIKLVRNELPAIASVFATASDEELMQAFETKLGARTSAVGVCNKLVWVVDVSYFPYAHYSLLSKGSTFGPRCCC